MAKIKKDYWGFDMKSRDTSVRPQDDFYRHVNGGWLKSAKIPEEESRWGSFMMLRFETEKQLKALVDEVVKKRHAVGSDAQLVSDVYKASLDMKQRNKVGLKPILPYRAMVQKAESIEQLIETIIDLHGHGLDELWGAAIDQDSKNSSRYLLHLWQSGLGLPDRDYYLLKKEEQKRVLSAYEAHVEKILALAGYTPAEAKEAREIIIKIETRLAAVSMSKEDMREPEKTYNKMSVAALSKLSPAIPWKKYLKTIHAGELKELVVAQPHFFKSMSAMLHEVSLEEWKRYFDFHIVNGAGSSLSQPFIDENFAFYGKTLTGQQKMRAPWRRALGTVSSIAGEALGKLYIAKHFPPQAKKVMDNLVSDLFVVFEEQSKGSRLDECSNKKEGPEETPQHEAQNRSSYQVEGLQRS
jgi:putative endopeptidase